jgi:hypothetical protein
MRNYHHDAFMTNFCAADKVMTAAEADLTASYQYAYTWGHERRFNSGKHKDPFEDAQRKLIYMREKHAPDYLLVYDTIQEDDKEHLYTLNLHTAPQNEVKIEGDSVYFTQYPTSASEKEMAYLSWPGERDAAGAYFSKGSPYNGDPKFGSATFKVNIPKSGKYDLYGFACTTSKENPYGSDSFFIRFGEQRATWGFPSYQWSKINKKPYDLTEGEEILTVLAREAEAKVMRFALYPVDAGIPLFNKPNDANFMVIDAGKPDSMDGTFITGKLTIPDKVEEASVAANMTLLQLAPRTGFSSDVVAQHIRLQTKAQSVKAQFLNFFYPKKPEMQQPTQRVVNEYTTEIIWDGCQDTICMKQGDGIASEGIASDADLVVIRKREGAVISFVMVNGSYLSVNNDTLITLAGGKGIAGWAEDTLSVSGKNVHNFSFHFPAAQRGDHQQLSHLLADGKEVKALKDENGWRAASSFVGRSVLTW